MVRINEEQGYCSSYRREFIQFVAHSRERIIPIDLGAIEILFEWAIDVSDQDAVFAQLPAN